ncbi:MAG TPA: GNAT family N-acetyltransferase [Acidimicrobiia bacterium]|nr:GNAT family N-acetyltransferase [Acidimicrobiia bacterium]
MTLPQGLVTRPLAPGDESVVTAVIAAGQLEDVGEVVIEEADVVSDWQRPSYDVGASTIGIFDDDRLIAYAELSGGDRGDAAVDPTYRGRGIGTFLANWMQGQARARGLQVIGMPVPRGSSGDRLLERLGYRIRWTSWALALPEGQVIEAPPLPPGYTIRTAELADHRAVWTVIEDAFLEWSVRDRQSFEDFSAQVLHRPGFEPWNLRVVTDGIGDVVGAVLILLADEVGFVERIAVRKDQRGMGLGQALLADAFARAREHGATRSELSTDSRTGALGLYERVGMEVTSVWVNRAIDL